MPRGTFCRKICHNPTRVTLMTGRAYTRHPLFQEPQYHDFALNGSATQVLTNSCREAHTR